MVYKGVIEMVKVKFSPGLEGYKKYGAEIEVNWQSGTIRDLLETLAVDPVEIGCVLVNNSPQDLDTKLADNSRVTLLPVLCGG